MKEFYKTYDESRRKDPKYSQNRIKGMLHFERNIKKRKSRY